MRFDDRLVGRAGLLQAERDSITRLLAVLEAARGFDEHAHEDDEQFHRRLGRLQAALVACDADPLLATKANTEA